jgi:glycosyltransferase involved in cell wall biosynthesis
MIDGKRICVVLPAFNAAKTLHMTYEAIPHGVVDDIIVVDDF